MKITDVTCSILRLPVVEAIGDGLQDVLIVEIQTDEGIVGIGEAHTMPLALKAIIEAPVSQYGVRGLREIVVGENPLEVEPIWERMWAFAGEILGRRGLIMHAMSAIDIALWDVKGKALGKPISAMIGPVLRDKIDVYASDLMPSDEVKAIEHASRHIAAGFRAVKFGWGNVGADVSKDVERMARLRATFGTDVDLMLDVGVPLPFQDALSLARRLEELQVFFLEEPLGAEDHAGYRELVGSTNLRIAAGEKETGLAGFRELITRANLPVIQPDVARVGGISEAVRIARLAAQFEVEVIPHCWSTDILVAASLHLLAGLEHAPFLEMNVTENPLRTTLTHPHFEQSEGKLTVPTLPGLGVELDRDVMEKFKVWC